jgi:hypothetical protein
LAWEVFFAWLILAAIVALLALILRAYLINVTAL